MSFLDELAGLEERVQRRMAELKPLVSEYHELEQVARRLGIDVDGLTRSQGSKASGDRSKRSGSHQGAAKGVGSSPTGRRASGSRSLGSASKSKRSRPEHPGAERKLSERQRQVLELVKRRPGITVPDLGREIGVDSTSLYRVVRRLEKDGSVKKKGKEVSPA